jgi:protoporphyrinogen oxidase
MGLDVIVVGAGISGLAFAQRCARAGKTTLVLERSATPGGCIQTQRVEGDFWWELGAHTAYNSYGQMLAMLEEGPGLGGLLPRAKAPFRLLVDGDIRSVASALSIPSLLWNARRILSTPKTGLTVKQYYSRLVGEQNYARVFGPLFAAVPSQPADNFPSDMLFKKRARRKDVFKSFTLAGGLMSVIDALAATPGVTVNCGAGVAAVARTERGFAVSVDGGAQHHAPALALAVDPSVAASLLRPAFPELAAALARIGGVTISTVGVAVKKEALKLGPVAGIIPLDGSFFSAVSRDTVPHPTYRGFAFHARPGTALEDQLALIARTLGVRTDQLEHVVQRQVTLPSPVLGHAQVVAEITSQLEGTPLHLVGNYFGGLALEDCVTRARQEADRLLKAGAPV